ncbi:hypothetical protein GCM10011490_05170 [Pseudoclavibacter endophyticus]|uniref:Uncharacterized protein n=1 Tax=Pseudoclavibacter endophyticus TaxID=1778590 RepID=A0A6H9WPE4_9MICO|nr:hypothetical protein [Pseudoclavibacter endophyticus]KAB1649978.1 hypothetical protein F8O04_07100 [Pseudoclavibacter endophyticus]GGA58216.1 hypothetical protein GCM10011490_05170 [Pseudoclavibacter endophyticus]
MTDDTTARQGDHVPGQGGIPVAPYPSQSNDPQPTPSHAIATFGGEGHGGSWPGADEAFIGDMTVTRDAIRSPQGAISARGAQIFVNNHTRLENKTPTWAIVLAIVGFFLVTFFSLFFLLVKEQRLGGGYEVVATGPDGTLTSFIPVDQQSAGYIWNDLQTRAEHARAVIADA